MALRALAQLLLGTLVPNTNRAASTQNDSQPTVGDHHSRPLECQEEKKQPGILRPSHSPGPATMNAAVATDLELWVHQTKQSLWAFGLPDPIGSGSSGNEKFG
jgi:hypothetical protein